MDDNGSISRRLVFLIWFILLHSSTARDSLTPLESIRDGDTLISAREVFELGFFSPSKSSNRYLGIWYCKIPNQPVVWVANRQYPLTDTSGVLRLGDGGTLMVLDGKGKDIWTGTGSASNNSVAVLLDSGNFVLRDGNSDDEENILWQSFDHPSDTWLPGMKLVLNLKTSENRMLTSWTSIEDPALGSFSYGIDPQGSKQMFIWRNSVPYWRSGLWNELTSTFAEVPEMSRINVTHRIFIRDGNEVYLTYIPHNISALVRTKMFADGQIKHFLWLENVRTWRPLWWQPKDRCSVYAQCGAYGICKNNSLVLCRCLNGFQPKSSKDWDSGTWPGGCVRQTPLNCSGRVEFLHLRRMKLPDQYNFLGDASLGLKDCEAKCRENCSCTAYASGRTNGSGCLFWGGDLMDIRVDDRGGEDLYVRLTASEFDEGMNSQGSPSKDRRLAVAVTVPVTLALILFGGGFVYLMWRLKWKVEHKGNTDDLLLLDVGTNETTVTKIPERGNTKKDGEKEADLPSFSFSSIVAATNNFSPANKLGEGGFGPVYKATLQKGTVAIKRLSKRSGQGPEEFKNEVILIAKLQHTNLVRLLGCCIQGEEKILVYEYMANKSLDSVLFDPIKRTLLDWGKRIHIIEGVAQGLLYLHKYSRLRIIHRDLKASNILLDEDMNPKISDFGTARTFGRNESQANTKRVVGTVGYMAPEYAVRGLFSEKSDVFSFGVLLLEIVSGRKNTGFYRADESSDLLTFAWQLWKEGRSLELMDSILSELPRCDELQISRCIQVGLLCVQEIPAARPSISDVIHMLSSETRPLAISKRPALSIGTKTMEADAPLHSIGHGSVNDQTIS